ncbi:hypothetical protein TRFO_22376 [Tritrichomonas foetus]|uniref:Uncharacterized protein n=1 Tax=Tritrichomonas foetus TaxID=1144522 RepID=A0A1J4KGM2_9EUKA|nr:hypothetical protein TRFO_22376 [Tritrichomonas foetus]|eukprot:OHT08948.1 hypothetical protein TRFO_22376 [Tritrichomonas foetus]
MNSPDQPSFQLPTSKNWVILGSMIFGCASTFLWVVDFLRLFRSMIGICGVVIIILGNAIESWTLYSSLSSGSICKIIRIIIFSIIVLIGLMIFGTSSIIDRAISSFSIVSSLIEVFYLIFGIVILIKQNRDIVQNINDRVNNQRNQNVTQTQVNSILSPDILMIEHFDDDRNLSGNDSNLTINFSTQTEYIMFGSLRPPINIQK